MIYAKGAGVPQNYKEAFKWWKLGAEQGDADAQYNLGIMYSKGRGVAQDYQEAGKYYSRSAKQNYSPAQLALVKLLLRFVDGDLKHILTAEQKGTLREGWQEIAENVMLLFNNKHASNKDREAAEDIWNKYKLWNYP